MDTGTKIKHQVEPEHYGEKYDSKRRFISYWHQINEALSLKPHNMLEIGIGNGFVYRYLKERAIDISTLDIDERLNPQFVGSITNMPFKDESFDLVMACEILEHIPYEDTLKGLKEIHRVAKRYAIISLPDSTRTIRIEFPIPKYGKVKKLFTLWNFFPKKHELTKSGHHWEIGKEHFPLEKVAHDIEALGFTIEKTYRVFENPYHRFFVLKK